MELFFGFFLTTLISFFAYNSFRKKKQKTIPDNLEWTPEPLVDETPKKSYPLVEPPSVIIKGKVGKWIVDVDNKKLLNFASHNYLGFVENPSIVEEAKNAIFKYGVGSCGPRGFYGTADVHLELESRICEFMKMESAIVYSYGFSTIASAIAAYAKKQDVIFADERVNFAIQRGIEAARSKVFYFKHNDTRDLESLIKSWDDTHQGTKEKSKIRKFIIVEGIYMNTGKISPLPRIIEIRKKYKLRIFIDESISFGVLGQTGRGILEHHDIPPDEVDMTMVSMEYGLSTGGGFCVGSTFIIEHQRLSGLGYCFSASLPPFLAVAARAGIDMIDEQRDLISTLSHRCHEVHIALLNSTILTTYFHIPSDLYSPIKHLILRKAFALGSYDKDFSLLNEIALYCKYRHIFITTSRYLVEKEHTTPPASIRLTVSVVMEQEDILELVQVLESAATEIFA